MPPELLSPAGSPQALAAAISAGADAVYLGLGTLNARRHAKGFTQEEFAAAVDRCRTLGVRVYLTLNTLVSDRELPQALKTARLACRLGVDAVLVQDWGLFDLLRACLPDLPLHASTQMSLFTSGAAAEAARAGCRRIVLGRECSRADTAAIAAACPAEIEVFVHGALCMSYSGQCTFSALVGGCSGNRGGCRQPCRLPYGYDAPAGSAYPLSLKDLSLADALDEASDAGVQCLKIEGRMKRPEYVAAVTGIYARLLREGRRPTAQERQTLEAAFSRSGFTAGLWKGQRGPALLGTRQVPSGAAAPFDRLDLPGRPPAAAELTCVLQRDRPTRLTARDGAGHTVTVTGPAPQAARTRALTAEEVRQRLMKTGGTPFSCRACAVTVEEGLYLSAAALNTLRRQALEALAALRRTPPVRRELPEPPPPEHRAVTAPPELTATVLTLPQAQALAPLGLSRLALPLEVLARCAALPPFSGQWCAVVPRAWRDGDEALLKKWLLHARHLGVSAALAGNLGHLPLLRPTGLSILGDYGLNVFNSRTLAHFAALGLESACLSFELRSSQIRDLRKPLPTELMVYGRLPLMLTESCLTQNEVGCTLDASGPAVPQRAPCRGRHVLQDRTAARFPLLPAFGHRTEIENAVPLYLADQAWWRSCGASYARLRFTDEPPQECVRILRAYRDGASPQGDFTRGLYRRGVE